MEIINFSRVNFILLIILTFTTPTIWANYIYVDNSLPLDCKNKSYSIVHRDCSGNDGNSFNTIQKAADAVSAGSIVSIRQGTYKESIIIKSSGSVNNPIELTNHLEELVLIDGEKILPKIKSGLGLVSIDSQEYVNISGLKITNSQYYGIKLIDSKHITIKNCEVSHSNHGGIVTEETGMDITIDGCDVHHNNSLGTAAWHEAITLSDVDTFEVKNCRVYDNKEDGIDAKYGSNNGSIHDNITYRNNGPNIYIDAAHNIDVYNNYIHDATSIYKPGLMLAVESNPNRYYTYNINVYNNVIFNNAAGIGFLIEPDPEKWANFSNIVISNNTVVNNNKNNWGAIYIFGGSEVNYGKGNVVVNNIFWNNTLKGGAKAIRDDIGVIHKFTVDHNLFKEGEPSATYGTNSILAKDVSFINSSASNFRLNTGSSAIDAGTPSLISNKDLDGNSRPFSKKYDLGAYEYIKYYSPATNLRIISINGQPL
jgi:parallel beta-helix repeat protein